MKICLAGTGAMGEIHVKALAKIDGVEVVSVAGRTEDGVKEFAAKWNIPYSSTNLEACIDRPGVDAVILTTPSDQHADQTRARASQGQARPGRDPDGAEPGGLPAHAGRGEERPERCCMVTHTRRFSSPHREIRRRIQEGTFHLHHMVVETYFFRRTNLNMHGQPRSWVDNLLWHHGCHSVDLAHWILDEPNWDVWGQKGPDHAELRHPDGHDRGHEVEEGPALHAWRCRSTTRGRSAGSTATSARRRPTRCTATR